MPNTPIIGKKTMLPCQKIQINVQILELRMWRTLKNICPINVLYFYLENWMFVRKPCNARILEIIPGRLMFR